MNLQEVTVKFRDSEPPLRGIITGFDAGVIFVQMPERPPLPCSFSRIENIEFHHEGEK